MKLCSSAPLLERRISLRRWALAAGTVGVLLLPTSFAWAQSADDAGVTRWTPPPADPRDIEGVWLPTSGGPPGGGAPPAAAAPAAPVAAAPRPAGVPADAPTEIGNLGGTPAQAGPPRGGRPGGPPGGGGGPPPGGPPGGGAAARSGTTLQCAPNTRMSGAGGGMSNLWLQDDEEIVEISEEDQDIARKIYLNVQHPKMLVPQPNGNSVGHWDGNTLVVDSIGFSGQGGNASDRHVVERIKKDGIYLIDDATVTENGRTQQQTLRQKWRSDLHVFENVCEENFQRYQIVNGQVVNPNLPPDEEK